MNKLIKITTNEEGKQLVSARELYEGLGLNKAVWSRWYPTNIQKNDFFKEGDEWVGIQHDVENSKGGRPTIDFAISLDFAKHIAMMARTEKSHEYRNYFLECEKEVLNTSQLSPELQMFNQMFKAIANQELANKQIKQDIQETKQEIQGIRDVVAINSNDWKDDCKKLITKIAYQLGGINHINDVYREIYSVLDKRLGVSLQTRLTNKRRRMADEGVCKSKRDNLNYISVIADDKKLIEGYISIVKELAIKYGADMKEVVQ